MATSLPKFTAYYISKTEIIGSVQHSQLLDPDRLINRCFYLENLPEKICAHEVSQPVTNKCHKFVVNSPVVLVGIFLYYGGNTRKSIAEMFKIKLFRFCCRPEPRRVRMKFLLLVTTKIIDDP